MVDSPLKMNIMKSITQFSFDVTNRNKQRKLPKKELYNSFHTEFERIVASFVKQTNRLSSLDQRNVNRGRVFVGNINLSLSVEER